MNKNKIIPIVLILISLAGFYFYIFNSKNNNTNEINVIQTKSTNMSTNQIESKDIIDEKLSEPKIEEENKLPKSEPISSLPKQKSISQILNLNSIKVSGGIWQNWDSDMEKDGPVIEIVYYNSLDDIITDDSTKKLPITADVKVYTTDKNSPLSGYKEERLVYSAHYLSNQIILGNISPKIRILKEEMNINQTTDYKYGYVSVTIHTPEQGDFSDRSNFIVLYE